jgi:hypothetical protein
VDLPTITVVSIDGDGGDVYFSSSEDGGRSFTLPKSLSHGQLPGNYRTMGAAYILDLGKNLIVTWAAYGLQPGERENDVQIALRLSRDRGSTFEPVRRLTTVRTRDGRGAIGPPRIHATSDAILFAWTERGDWSDNRKGTLWFLRVSP